MKNRISQERKFQLHYGEGTEADYKPFIQAREFSSSGTCSCPIDWKTGRTVELLSQGEAMLWHILRWNEDILDIREQYPLDLEQTVMIAEKLGIRHPVSRNFTMTTDFVVTFLDEHIEAFSLKPNMQLKHRTLEKLTIEAVYWKLHGIKYHLICKEDLNQTEYNNIRTVVPYYSAETIHDDFSWIKHMIAVHKITVDMSKPIDYPSLIVKYKDGINNGH